MAFKDEDQVSHGSESVSRVERRLVSHGLYVDKGMPPDTPPNELVDFIVQKINQATTLTLPLADDMAVQVPTRNLYSIKRISDVFGICIYLFSSRAKPIHLLPEKSRATIAIIHDVSSIAGQSEFLAIKSSQRHDRIGDMRDKREVWYIKYLYLN